MSLPSWHLCRCCHKRLQLMFFIERTCVQKWCCMKRAFWIVKCLLSQGRACVGCRIVPYLEDKFPKRKLGKPDEVPQV